ncbi:MFS transporter [Microbacterium sp. GXF7504]
MPNQGAIVAVLAAAGLASSFMFTLVVPIQAQLPELLHASRDDTAWVITSTLLAAAVITPIAGRLGDMYGKRRIVLVLLGLLVAGSVLAAVSTSIVPMIIGRTLQGAMSGVIPLGISILRDVLHEKRVDAAVALISATLGVGGAIGMPVSALVTQYLNWHMLFWMSAAMGAIVFVLVLWLVPVSVLRSGGRFDVVGAVGLSVGLVGILLAISRGNEWGWTSPATLGCAIGGVVVLLVWGVYQLRVPTPLLDLRVAARPAVLLTNLASVAIGFGLFASSVAYPQILELPVASGAGLGLTIVEAAFVVMPSGLVMMVLSPFSGKLASTVGPKLLLVLGSVALVVAYGISLWSTAEVWHILVANLFVGVGIGFGYASMPMLIMRSVPQSETGASNGLNTLFRSLGTSSASAIVGAVLAGYTIDLDGVAVPSAEGFQVAFVWGMGAAVVALVIALCLPRRRDPHELHPSLPH